MSSAENKSIIQRLVEGLNDKDPSIIDAVYSTKYVGHDPDRPTGSRGIEDMRQVMAVVHGKVFPDAHYMTEALVAEGDMVVWHWLFRATHSAELQGILAIGKKVAFGGVNIFRLANGKIVEDWVYRDSVGLMRQLGALPAPGR